MTEWIRGETADRDLRTRLLFGRRESRRFLADAERSPRARALYTLAMTAKLGARECSAFDVRDITSDGVRACELLSVRRMDRRWRHLPDAREVVLPPEARAVLEEYLGWRRGRCGHFKHRLKSYRDLRGVERCHACHDVLDFLKAPLFLNRRNGRLSARGLWEEFRVMRTRLGLAEGLRFESLRRARVRETTSSSTATATPASAASARCEAVPPGTKR